MQVRLTDGIFITRISDLGTYHVTHAGLMFHILERDSDTLYVEVLQPHTLEGYLWLVLRTTDERYARWYSYTTPERDYDFFSTRSEALAYYSPSCDNETLVYKHDNTWYASWKAGDVHCTAPTLAALLTTYTEAASFVKYDVD